MRKSLMLMILALPFAPAADDRGPAPLPADKAAKAMVAARRLPRHGLRGRAGRRAADLVLPSTTAAGCSSPRRSTTATWQADRQGPHRHPRRHRRRRPGRQAHASSTRGFNYVTGIEVGFGGVWVMSPPNLYFIPDRDGDDKPDGAPRSAVRRLRLQGEPAQPRERLHLGAGRLALRRARPHQPVRRRPARHAGGEAHPLRRRRRTASTRRGSCSRTSPTARPTRGASTSTTTASASCPTA